MRKILPTLFIILLLLMIGIYLKPLFDFTCGNDIRQKVPSPSGQKVAYVFDRSCGATTGFAPQLSIFNKEQEFPNEAGNTFSSDKDFSIEWMNEDLLRVIYPKSAEPNKMDKKVNGVKIEYVTE